MCGVCRSEPAGREPKSQLGVAHRTRSRHAPGRSNRRANPGPGQTVLCYLWVLWSQTPSRPTGAALRACSPACPQASKAAYSPSYPPTGAALRTCPLARPQARVSPSSGEKAVGLPRAVFVPQRAASSIHDTCGIHAAAPIFSYFFGPILAIPERTLAPARFPVSMFPVGSVGPNPEQADRLL